MQVGLQLSRIYKLFRLKIPCTRNLQVQRDKSSQPHRERVATQNDQGRLRYALNLRVQFKTTQKFHRQAPSEMGKIRLHRQRWMPWEPTCRHLKRECRLSKSSVTSGRPRPRVLQATSWAHSKTWRLISTLSSETTKRACIRCARSLTTDCVSLPIKSRWRACHTFKMMALSVAQICSTSAVEAHLKPVAIKLPWATQTKSLSSKTRENLNVIKVSLEKPCHSTKIFRMSLALLLAK